MAESARSCKKRSKSDYCRREIARTAAKDRRDKENDIFAELQAAIPATDGSDASHIDRIAQLRLAATLFRLRGCAPKLMKTLLNDSKSSDLWSEDQVTQCLDGFIMICDGDGIVLYITESVSKYLGLTQTDFIGQMLQDFVHHNERDDLRQAMIKLEARDEGHLFVMRMKSVVGPRGRKLSLKSPFMKPITFFLRALDNEKTKPRTWLLLATTAAPTGSGSLYDEVVKHYSPNDTFVTRHTCDMKFSYADECLIGYLKLEPRKLIGTSFYDLVHPEDLLNLVKSLKDLFKKMHCSTPYYRLMGGSGIVIWVQTEAGVVSYTSRNQRRQYVICVHQMLGEQSGIESDVISVDADTSSVISIHSSTATDDSYDKCYSQQSIECHEVPSENSNRQLKQELEIVQPAQIDQRMDSYNDVLQWLVSDLPDSLLSDPDAMLDSGKTNQLAVDSKTTSNLCQADANATEFSLPSAGLADSRLQDSKDNDIGDISFVHLAITSPPQYFEDEGYRHDNNVNAYPKVSTVPPTTDSFSYEDMPEMLETLAPFVAQEEMLPLDMQGLISDFNMDDWFPSDLLMQQNQNLTERPLMTPPPHAAIPYQSGMSYIDAAPNTQFQQQYQDSSSYAIAKPFMQDINYGQQQQPISQASLHNGCNQTHPMPIHYGII